MGADRERCCSDRFRGVDRVVSGRAGGGLASIGQTSRGTPRLVRAEVLMGWVVAYLALVALGLLFNYGAHGGLRES